MNRKPEITEQTRRNLREAFWSLYADRPVSRITVKQITDLAGYHRATFYLYYSDVFQLLETEEENLLKEIAALFENAASADSAAVFYEKLCSLLYVMQKNYRYACTLLSDHGDPAFISRLKDLMWPFINRFFVPTDGTDSYQNAILREFYLSGILGAVRMWLENPEMEIQEVVAFLIPHVFRAG